MARARMAAVRRRGIARQWGRGGGGGEGVASEEGELQATSEYGCAGAWARRWRERCACAGRSCKAVGGRIYAQGGRGVLVLTMS